MMNIPFYRSHSPQQHRSLNLPPFQHHHHQQEEYLREQQLQQRYLQHQQEKEHEAMMKSSYFNPYLWSMPSNPLSSSSTINYRHLISQQRHQQQQHRHNNNAFQQRPSFNLSSFPPPTFDPPSLMPPPLSSATSPSPPSPLSSDESAVTEETARQIFFRVLSEYLKEANKFFCGKTTSWKNPFLYKTTLCVNFSMRLYCRFGVNCWYAHGNHELRCIPVSENLPDPTFIKKYLSFLGLPSNILDEIIQRAYSVALLFGSETKKTSSSLSSFVPTPSTSSSSLSPINNTHALPSPVDNHGQSPFAAASTTTNSMKASESSNKFYSYFPALNGGHGGTWATDIQSAINDAVDDNTAAADGNKVDPEDIPFSKGYNLFGNSFNLQKSW